MRTSKNNITNNIIYWNIKDDNTLISHSFITNRVLAPTNASEMIY